MWVCCALTWALPVLISLSFSGKFHTTEVKNWVDELKTERSKNSNSAVR